jgi:uncharacterized membrane protein YcfT
MLLIVVLMQLKVKVRAQTPSMKLLKIQNKDTISIYLASAGSVQYFVKDLVQIMTQKPTMYESCMTAC